MIVLKLLAHFTVGAVACWAFGRDEGGGWPGWKLGLENILKGRNKLLTKGAEMQPNLNLLQLFKGADILSRYDDKCIVSANDGEIYIYGWSPERIARCGPGLEDLATLTRAGWFWEEKSVVWIHYT